MWKNKLLDWVSLVFISSICFVMFGYLVKFVFIDKVELFTIDSPLVYVFLIACVILICLAATTYGEFKSLEKGKHADKAALKELFKELKIVAIFTIGILVYISLLKYLHFIIGSIVFLAIGMLFMNKSSDKTIIKTAKVCAASIITVPILYYVFYGIFHVKLP